MATQITQKKKEIAFRQGRVLELKLMGGDNTAIAEEMGVNKTTIAGDIKRLGELSEGGIRDELEARTGRKFPKAGELPAKPITQQEREIADRQGRVLELTLMGEDKTTVAGELGVSETTVSKDLNRLMELSEGRLREELGARVGERISRGTKEEVAFRRGRVLELRLMGGTEAAIAEELGAGRTTVENDLTVLRRLAVGPIKELLGEVRGYRFGEKEIASRQGRVLELKLMGEKNVAIAGELGVTPTTVKNDLKVLRELAVGPIKELLEAYPQRKLHQPNEKELAYRQGRVLELKLMGETNARMAEELGVSTSTVRSDVRLLRRLAVGPIKELLEVVWVGGSGVSGGESGGESGAGQQTNVKVDGRRIVVVGTTREKRIAYRQGRVLELRLMGETEPRIADELGVDVMVVSQDIRHLKKLAEGPIKELLERGKHSWGEKKDVAYRQGRVLELRLMGESQNAIARNLRTDVTTVADDLRRLKSLAQGSIKELLGEGARPPSWQTQKKIAERQGRVLELKLMGYSDREITEELGVGQRTVWRDMNRLRELAEGPIKELLDVEIRRRKKIV